MVKREKPEPSSLTVHAVGEMLCVSTSTVRRLIADREFPNVFKVRTSVRIPRGDVDAYLVRCQQFPREQGEQR